MFRCTSGNIKAPRLWPFVRGIPRRPVVSPHKGAITWKMFPYHDMTSSCGVINTWISEMLFRDFQIRWILCTCLFRRYISCCRDIRIPQWPTIVSTSRILETYAWYVKLLYPIKYLHAHCFVVCIIGVIISDSCKWFIWYMHTDVVQSCAISAEAIIWSVPKDMVKIDSTSSKSWQQTTKNRQFV